MHQHHEGNKDPPPHIFRLNSANEYKAQFSLSTSPSPPEERQGSNNPSQRGDSFTILFFLVQRSNYLRLDNLRCTILLYRLHFHLSLRGASGPDEGCLKEGERLVTGLSFQRTLLLLQNKHIKRGLPLSEQSSFQRHVSRLIIVFQHLIRCRILHYIRCTTVRHAIF